MIDNDEGASVTEDLSAFETEFYQTNVEDTKAPENTETPEEDSLATDDTTDEAEDETETPDEPQEEPKPKKKKSAQERIDEIYADKKESERREAATAAALEKALQKLEELTAKPEAPEAKAETLTNKGPTPDDLDENGDAKYPLGEFDPAFLLDMNKHFFETQRELDRQERAREEAERAVALERETLQTQWNEKITATEADLPDFREKVTSLDTVTADLPADYQQYLAETIMSLEAGPEVLYYLADNPDEARKIVVSGTRNATIAIGRLEGILRKERTNKQIKPTSAPPPPDASTRGAGGRFEVPDDTDDLSAFERKFFKK